MSIRLVKELSDIIFEFLYWEKHLTKIKIIDHHTKTIKEQPRIFHKTVELNK